MRPSAGMLSVLLFGLAVTFELSGLTVTMVNRTGDTIVEIYVSKNSSSWNTDVLKEGAMLNGERLRVTFPGETGTYYVKAVTAGGGEYLLNERQIKEGTTLVITSADVVKDGISSGFSAENHQFHGESHSSDPYTAWGSERGRPGRRTLGRKGGNAAGRGAFHPVFGRIRGETVLHRTRRRGGNELFQIRCGRIA